MKEVSRRTFPNLLTVSDVAKLFKISKSSVYRMVESRILPFYRIPAGLRFKEEELLQYIESQRVKSRDECFYVKNHKSRKNLY